MAYPNWVFSMFSFLGFALVIIPLPWHLHAWNAGTVMFMLWTAVGCLNVFVNSIVWNGNVNNPAPVWCDISIRIYFGLSVAIASTSLCINRRLYEISIAETVSTTKADKRRAMYIDLAITIIIPVLEMVLAYIPQGHRFDIYEDVGCYPEVYDTWVAILIVFVPPLAISCVSATYCARSIWFFNKRRRHFQELLSGSAGSRLTTGRYLRLMGLASMEFVVSIPLASYCIYTNVAVNGIHPWISWANTHSNFSNVNLFPSLFWENSKGAANIEFSRWMPVVCSIVFFAFFGFAQEALRHYRRAYDVVASRVGLPTR
ncbi:pheromone receptor, partial [Fistulina hepatica ATCC 64428]